MYAQLEKTMTQLENRLDKAIQRLNTRQAETRTLRDNIDGLRKERLALNETLAKMNGQLAAQRQDATRLLRTSQSECEGRDKVCWSCRSVLSQTYLSPLCVIRHLMSPDLAEREHRYI